MPYRLQGDFEKQMITTTHFRQECYESPKTLLILFSYVQQLQFYDIALLFDDHYAGKDNW